VRARHRDGDRSRLDVEVDLGAKQEIDQPRRVAANLGQERPGAVVVDGAVEEETDPAGDAQVGEEAPLGLRGGPPGPRGGLG